MQRGKFITFEGGEAVGKSTQTKRLVENLAQIGIDAVLTREPGGVPAAEEIRQILLHGDADKWDPLAETLLLNAGRRQHILELIEPSLASGKWVICDRFLDSTLVYQGTIKKLPSDIILQLHRIAQDNLQPDLTLVMDVPGDVTLARVAKRKFAQDRIEAQHSRIHEDLRQAFLTIAYNAPERCVIIDALQSKDEVASGIWQKVRHKFQLEQRA
jgi:dTMP kinase